MQKIKIPGVTNITPGIFLYANGQNSGENSR